MNETMPGRGRWLAAIAAGLALLTAGCGGTGPPSASGSSDYQRDAAFARCMRARGVPDFPDPQPQGGFPGGLIDKNAPQVRTAHAACHQLLPPIRLPGAADARQGQERILQWVKCLRAHGFPDFPEPSAGPGGLLTFSDPPGFDSNSPLAMAAHRACPGGPHGG